MAFGGHGDGGVRDPMGQFGQRISGAGCNHKGVQQLFRADGLRLPDGEDRSMAGTPLCPFHKDGGVAKSGVGHRGSLRKDGLDFKCYNCV